MRIHKSNLSSVDLVSTDKHMPLLNNLRIEKDGTTAVCNREAVLVVSPYGSVREKVGDGFGGVTVAAGTSLEVLKSLPRGTGYDDLLDAVDVTREDDGRVVFRYSDGVRRRAIEAREFSQPFVRYKEIIRKRLSTKKSIKLVVNRKRMADVFKTLNKVAPDPSGEFPVFLEFSEDAVIIRCIHPKTQQRIICVVNQAYTSKWMDENEWERSLSNEKHVIRAKKIK